MHALEHTGTVKGLFVSFLRFYVASNMCGTIDEFIDGDGTLLAWTQTIVYGNTLRAMWYVVQSHHSLRHTLR